MECWVLKHVFHALKLHMSNHVKAKEVAFQGCFWWYARCQHSIAQHCRCIGMQHYQSSITSRVNETEVIDAFRPGRLTVTLLQDQGQLCSLRVDLPRIPMLVLSESMGYCPNVIYYIDLYSLLISCDFLVGKIA